MNGSEILYDDEEFERILPELIENFVEEHGRQPTEEEIEQIKEDYLNTDMEAALKAQIISEFKEENGRDPTEDEVNERLAAALSADDEEASEGDDDEDDEEGDGEEGDDDGDKE